MMWFDTDPEQGSSGFADLLSDSLTFFFTLLIVGGAIGVLWWMA